MPFQPGVSGNPGGRGDDKPWRAALVRALRIADGDPDELDELARVTIARGKAGDIQAVKEIADRLDGKVPQAIVGASGHPPVQMTIVVTGVPRPEDDRGSGKPGDPKP